MQWLSETGKFHPRGRLLISQYRPIKPLSPQGTYHKRPPNAWLITGSGKCGVDLLLHAVAAANLWLLLSILYLTTVSAPRSQY